MYSTEFSEYTANWCKKYLFDERTKMDHTDLLKLYGNFIKELTEKKMSIEDYKKELGVRNIIEKLINDLRNTDLDLQRDCSRFTLSVLRFDNELKSKVKYINCDRHNWWDYTYPLRIKRKPTRV